MNILFLPYLGACLFLPLFDDQIAAELEQQSERDVQHARAFESERWSRRSAWRIRGENFCRLFSLLL